MPHSPSFLPPVALLAGGLATRLHPTTLTIPKSLIEVAGEPFIFHQLRLLAREGVREVVICGGHLGERIEAAVGDGSRFGCRVRYSYDGEALLGTGGALQKALPLLGSTFMVMYGDSYLDIPFGPVYEAFRAFGQPALMTVFRNEGKWDTSNIAFEGGLIRRYDKTNRTPAMQHIDYGLSVLNASVLEARPEGAFDLAELFKALVAAGQMAGYEVTKRFYEIGSPEGLAETDAYLRAQRKTA